MEPTYLSVLNAIKERSLVAKTQTPISSLQTDSGALGQQKNQEPIKKLQILSKQEAAVETKLNEYKDFLQKSPSEKKEIFAMVDDIMSWLLPKDDKDTSPKISPNLGQFYQSIIQTLTDATLQLPNLHPDKDMPKDYFQNLSEKINGLDALMWGNLDFIKDKKLSSAESSISGANYKNIKRMIHFYNGQLDDCVRTLIGDIKNRRGIAQGKSLDEIEAAVKIYLERFNDTILSQKLGEVLGEISKISVFAISGIKHLLRSTNMMSKVAKSDATKRSMLKADYEELQEWILKNEESYPSRKREISLVEQHDSKQQPNIEQQQSKENVYEQRSQEIIPPSPDRQEQSEAIVTERASTQHVVPTSGGRGEEPSRSGIFDVLGDIWDGITSVLSSFFNALWSFNPFRSR